MAIERGKVPGADVLVEAVDVDPAALDELGEEGGHVHVRGDPVGGLREVADASLVLRQLLEDEVALEVEIGMLVHPALAIEIEPEQRVHRLAEARIGEAGQVIEVRPRRPAEVDVEVLVIPDVVLNRDAHVRGDLAEMGDREVEPLDQRLGVGR